MRSAAKILCQGNFPDSQEKKGGVFILTLIEPCQGVRIVFS